MTKPVKIEPKNKKGEERKWTSRKRKSSQPYTLPVEAAKGATKRQQYIQLVECPTDRPHVPYDLAHRVPNEIMTEFMTWLMNEDMGPHKPGMDTLFWRNCTTKDLF